MSLLPPPTLDIPDSSRLQSFAGKVSQCDLLWYMTCSNHGIKLASQEREYKKADTNIVLLRGGHLSPALHAPYGNNDCFWHAVLCRDLLQQRPVLLHHVHPQLYSVVRHHPSGKSIVLIISKELHTPRAHHPTEDNSFLVGLEGIRTPEFIILHQSHHPTENG
jgi:hypothetical protein